MLPSWQTATVLAPTSIGQLGCQARLRPRPLPQVARGIPGPVFLPRPLFLPVLPPEAGVGEGRLGLPAEASAQASAVPGMVGAIQKFGQLIHWHPHIHALVTEGVFLPDLAACGHAQAGGTFLPLPKLATEPFLKLWEQEVFALLLA